MSLADITGLFLASLSRLITGTQGHWKGCPPTAEQRIYFANHQSHFDWVLIWAALPRDLRARTRPIAARDYWANTPLKKWLTSAVFNAVYVSRTRATPDEDPLEPLVEALKAGDSLVIFPEGTRSNKGDPQAFKAGLFHLARQFPEVQLIPTWIDNVQRVMPKGEVVPVPILCTVTFGEPLQVGADEDKADFLPRARQALIAQRPSTESRGGGA
jgi:1-acyl-sn-glycerol-3-phosphate acyltransferase